VRIVDRLPVNATGKVVKDLLRDQLVRDGSGAPV
jgi:acyl-coenzyme A synthetase/AMP-(fatty) acid ligase